MKHPSRLCRAASLAAAVCITGALGAAGTASAIIPNDSDHIRKGNDGSALERHLCPPKSLCLYQNSNQRGDMVYLSCRFKDAGKLRRLTFGRGAAGGVSSYDVNLSRAIVLDDANGRSKLIRGVGNVPLDLNDKLSSAQLFC